MKRIKNIYKRINNSKIIISKKKLYIKLFNISTYKFFDSKKKNGFSIIT